MRGRGRKREGKERGKEEKEITNQGFHIFDEKNLFGSE